MVGTAAAAAAAAVEATVGAGTATAGATTTVVDRTTKAGEIADIETARAARAAPARRHP